jgi:hypothetical protein
MLGITEPILTYATEELILGHIELFLECVMEMQGHIFRPFPFPLFATTLPEKLANMADALWAWVMLICFCSLFLPFPYSALSYPSSWRPCL